VRYTYEYTEAGTLLIYDAQSSNEGPEWTHEVAPSTGLPWSSKEEAEAFAQRFISELISCGRG